MMLGLDELTIFIILYVIGLIGFVYGLIK